MLLAVVVLLAALGLGRLGGGSLARLGGLPLDARRLVPIALLVQLGGGLVGGPAYVLGLAVSAALLGVFLLRNRDLRGTGLVALGLLANALAVGLNGAMPVAEAAAARAGIATQDILTGADPRHQPADDSTFARRTAVGDDNTIGRGLLASVTTEANADCHWSSLLIR